jgi:glycerol-3-phosphate O-acyltransferase / dihydroxyacetone phosphate acyltransferase
MPASLKAVKISDLIFRRRGTLFFRFLLSAFGIALSLFFRRIETVNADEVPKTGGVIFVLNHPNGLVDPALVFVSLPRRISFLAKSTLFRMPVISAILTTAEALPVYRRIDAGEDVTKNQLTFAAARERLRSGGSIALFPEGVSHNSPKLLPFKTGAARIALGAAAADENGRPLSVSIVPVGLFYTNKTTFRSEALLHFGEAFAVPNVELEEDGQPPREAVRELTAEIETRLKAVTLNARSESELATARIAEEIFASSAESENLGDKLDFLKIYLADGRGVGNGELDKKLREYDRSLDKYGIEPYHLSLSQFSPRFVWWQAFQRTWKLIFLFPFAAAGTMLHFPAYQLCKLLSYLITHHGADDVASTVKVLAAMLFMPVTWLATGVAIWWFWGWQPALISIPVAIGLGYAALYSLEEAAELRGWARAVWLFLFRRERFLRLFVERRDLYREIAAKTSSPVPGH